jgi:hypothetical protein
MKLTAVRAHGEHWNVDQEQSAHETVANLVGGFGVGSTEKSCPTAPHLCLKLIDASPTLVLFTHARGPMQSRWRTPKLTKLTHTPPRVRAGSLPLLRFAEGAR